MRKTTLAGGTERSMLGVWKCLHLGYSLVPTTDHLALAHAELERLATGPRRVEDGAVVQGAHVMDHCSLTGLGEGDAWKMCRFGLVKFQVLVAWELQQLSGKQLH